MNESTVAALLDYLKLRLDPSELAAAKSIIDDGELGTDQPPAFGGAPRAGGGMVPLTAQDARPKYAFDGAISATRRVAEMLRAIDEVAPHVGREAVLGCDGAASVFRTALAHLGYKDPTLHASALPLMFRTWSRNRNTVRAGGGPRPMPVVTGDAATDRDFAKRFPDASKVRVI